jgi:hypothetical protein
VNLKEFKEEFEKSKQTTLSATASASTTPQTPSPAPATTPHPWSKAALLAKAQRSAEVMLGYAHDDWRFGRESTFVLEFVARAALAHVNPALLADPQDWNNLYYALGPTEGVEVCPKVSRCREGP